MITIIAATDYSPTAENAVAYAAALAKQCNARLLLFNAFKLSVHEANTLLPASRIAKLEQENHHRLQQEADRISRKYMISVDAATRYTSVEDGLQDLVVLHGATLVVLGMAPQSLQQDFWGNTTTAVISKMAFPVLTVPGDSQFRGLQTILFASDQDDHMRSRQFLLDIQKKTGIFVCASSVEIFYVSKPVNGIEDEAEGLPEENNGMFCTYRDVQSAAIIRAIKQEITATGAELLLMIPAKYGFWSSLAHRSKTNRMASGLSIPLLAVPV